MESLLEFAAENDLQRFKDLVDEDPSLVDAIGFWYVRTKKSNQMIYEQRTPLMVAATYGSVDIVSFILSFPEVDVNRRVGHEMTTALHCAASSGSSNVVEVVNCLIVAGADLNLSDANGLKAVDVIFVFPKMTSHEKTALEDLLGNSSIKKPETLRVVTSVHDNEDRDEEDDLDLLSSPVAGERKEYPIDPTIPDIKNSIYSTDEFRMFSFKVRPCSRAYSHDWTECPFVHPGENARRRDPRKFHYSCVPCPDFRKGACRRGDLCEYAHGVFECWLHPAQYRTRQCKDGVGCSRRICFFAHTNDELRPLFVSTGSAIPSPRSMDMFRNPFASPSGLSSTNPWPQQNVPTLHLPGSSSNGLQSSRLRASMLNDMCFSPTRGSRLNSLVGSRSLNPSNLDDVFGGENLSSPRYGLDQGSLFSPSSVYKSNMNVDTNQLLHASLGISSSPSRMSPRSFEQQSPLSARLSSLAQQEKLQQLRSPLNSSWSNWGSPSGKLDWGVNGEELDMINRSKVRNDDSDVTWMVNPNDSKEEGAVSNGVYEDSDANVQVEEHAVLGDWLENMQLGPFVAS